MLKGSDKSEKQESVIRSIKTREKVIKMFDDYSRSASEAKCKRKYEEWFKILTLKKMLQRLQIDLAQK